MDNRVGNRQYNRGFDLACKEVKNITYSSGFGLKEFGIGTFFTSHRCKLFVLYIKDFR